MLCTCMQWRALAFLLFHLWCLWQVSVAACWQWWSRWLLDDHCCWDDEWDFWKDGTKAGWLKPGWIKMAGHCPNEQQNWGIWGEIKAWCGLQDRYGVCGGKYEFFPSISSITGCCHIPALLCFCCVWEDHSPHEGFHSSHQHSPSTNHQQAMTSPAAQAAVGQSCQEKLYFWLDSLLGCKPQKSFLAFFICRGICAWKHEGFFPAVSVAPRKKKCNFLMQSMSVISVDMYHSYITICNLAHGIQCELQIRACWNAVQEPQGHLKPFFNCNLTFTDTKIYLHNMEGGRRLELKPGEA